MDTKTEHKPPSANPHGCITILLGAGFSVSLGCPLVRDFRLKAGELSYNQQPTREQRENLQAYFDVRRSLQRNLGIAEIDLENIESLYSLLSLKLLVEPTQELQELDSKLRGFIVDCVSTGLSLPTSKRSTAFLVDGALAAGNHLSFLTHLYRTRAKLHFISFNYDFNLEFLLSSLGIPWSYSDKPGNAVISKLHGSMNWYECSCNDRVNSTEVKRIELGFGSVNLTTNKTCRLCGSLVKPLIIPPTWGKRYDSTFIQSQWQQAFKILRTSDRLIAIGYSLPETDTAVRQLLSLGVNDELITEVTVIAGPDESTAKRWSDLFRQSWRTTFLRAFPKTFEASVSSVLVPSIITTSQAPALLPLAKSIGTDSHADTIAAIASALSPMYFSNLEISQLSYLLSDNPQAKIVDAFRGTAFDWTPPDIISVDLD